MPFICVHLRLSAASHSAASNEPSTHSLPPPAFHPLRHDRL
jgi:hypothetical protein